jgi:hypothetical protein
MMIPINKRYVRIVAYVGIVVCSASALADLSIGNYRDAGAYAFFTAANVITLIMYRRR